MPIRIAPGSAACSSRLREVDRVAGDERLARPRVAGDDLAGVDADPARELDAPGRRELGVELGEAPLHLGRGPHGSERVVLVHDRDAEDGHHLVAAEPLDRAAVLPDDLGHRLRVARHHPPGRLRVGRLAERRRADDVAEEDRHRLPHLEALAGGLGERGAAGAAEARAASVRLATTVTNGHGRSVGRWPPGSSGAGARRYADRPCSTRSPTASRTPSATSVAARASTRRRSRARRARSASRCSRPTSTSRS